MKKCWKKIKLPKKRGLEQIMIVDGYLKIYLFKMDKSFGKDDFYKSPNFFPLSLIGGKNKVKKYDKRRI